VYPTNTTGYSWSQSLYGPLGEDGNFTWTAGFRAHHSPFESESEYWSGLSRNFHTFAESSQPPAVPSESTQIIDDTGSTLRSFLPITDPNIRQNLINFSGLASVFDLRVSCVRPTLLTGLLNEKTVDLTLALPSVNNVIPQLTTTSREIQLQFPRIFAFNGAYRYHIVPLDTSVGGMLSSLDESSRQKIKLNYRKYAQIQRQARFGGRVNPSGVWRTSNGESSCGVDLGSAYLIMTCLYSESQPNENLVIKQTSRGTGGAWQGLELVSPSSPALGSMSICFDSL
jgi:hypothetical protein